MADLITLDEYKIAKGLTNTDKDAALEQLITSSSSLIQRYLGYPIVDEGEERIEVINLDYNADTLFLDFYPVTELISITEMDPSLGGSTIHFPVEESSYYFDAFDGKLIRTGGTYWPQAPVVVTYRTGVADAEIVPADLKRAVIDLVTYYYKEEYKDSMQLRGASINNNTGTGNNSNSPNTKFPPHIQRVLDLYR